MNPKIDVAHALLCLCALALASCTSPQSATESGMRQDETARGPAGATAQPAPRVESGGDMAPSIAEGTTIGGADVRSVKEPMARARLHDMKRREWEPSRSLNVKPDSRAAP